VKAKCWDIDARVVMECSLSDSVKDKIAKVFEDAQQSAPSLIIIEDIHQLCPHADVGPSETDRQTTAGLMMCLDAIHHLPAEKMVVVVATSSAVDKVDTSLRRPGRFDKEIEVPIPTSIERTELLGFLVGKVHHDLKEDEICKIAEMAHGHVGGDLKALCMEAQQVSLGQCLQQHNRLRFPSTNTHSSTSNGVHSSTSTGVNSSTSVSLDLSEYCVRYEHFMEALHRVRPSAMREVQVEVPKVHWSDIGGLEDIKSKLKESVEWPLKHPEAFSRLGIKPPKGVLLYGPPGCSKTMIARALATESRLNFIAVKGPELFSKYVGDSERAVRQVFFRARAAAPSIVFFDEIDALAVHRKSDGGSSVADRVLAQLLTEMDGVEHLSDVLVVAATNRPDMIDKALLRPGRIDRLVYVPLPDSNTRREIFNIQFRSTPIADDVDVDGLVGRTAGYSGAEIVSVCQEAALSALHDSIRTEEVKQSHFENALETVHPQTESSTVRFYESYHKSRISSKKVFQFDGF
jgi:AAA family ATPase